MSKAAFIAALIFSGSFSQSLKPPLSWEKTFHPINGVLAQYVAKEKRDGFASNIVITKARMPCCRENDTSIDSLIAKVILMQERIFPMFKVRETLKRKIGGCAGGLLVTSYAQGSRDLANLQFFFLKGEDFYNVVYTCLLKDLDKWRTEFENSLETLRLDDEKPTEK